MDNLLVDFLPIDLFKIAEVLLNKMSYESYKKTTKSTDSLIKFAERTYKEYLTLKEANQLLRACTQLENL